jgi:hypothetical protein
MNDSLTLEGSESVPKVCRPHVVFVLAHEHGDTVGAACATLPDETVSVLQEAVALWRDETLRVKRTWEAIDRHGLAGLVVIYLMGPKAEVPIPPPIQVPFEPQELVESNGALLEIVLSGSGESLESLVPRNRVALWQRLKIYLGVPLMVFAWVAGLFFHILSQGSRLSTAAAPIFVTLAIVGAALFVRAMGGRWFLVPGGVALRRSPLRPRGVMLFTRENAFLVIRVVHVSGRGTNWSLWNATVHSRARTAKRRLTRTECIALLAGWLSPVQPPTPKQMVDLC